MPVWLGFLTALAVSAACSLGMVLQKKGIGWQTKGRARDASWRRERRVWLLGFLLVFIVPALNFIALSALSPAVVGAIAGAGLAFTVFFSALILREKLEAREIVASAVLFAGILGFTLFKGEEGDRAWSWPFFALVWALPFAVGGSAWLAMRARRARLGVRETAGGFLHSNPYGVVMGAVSGALAGLMLIVMKLFQIECGWDLLRYPLTPFMYAHLSVGVAGPYAMQLAYRHGSMLSVAPASAGISVVYPVAATWLVFSGTPHPLQLGSLAVIVGSVLVLAAGSAGKRRAANASLMSGETRVRKGGPARRFLRALHELRSPRPDAPEPGTASGGRPVDGGRRRK